MRRADIRSAKPHRLHGRRRDATASRGVRTMSPWQIQAQTAMPNLSGNFRCEKRAILASWASDACAIEAVPTLRCLPGGKRPVHFDEVSELGAGLLTGGVGWPHIEVALQMD